MAQRPFRAMGAASIVAAYLITSRREQWSTLVLAQSFCASYLAMFFSWAFGAVFLYPVFLSPLRHLPEPTGNSFWNGQYRKIQAEPSGVPQIEWINSIPNDGLIRYKGILNQERLLPTNQKSLAEILVTKNYDFQKPGSFVNTIGRILGVGILLAEGDEHKMQRRNLLPAFAFRHVKDLYPVFWSKSAESVRAMTEQVLLDAATKENLPPVPVESQPTGLPRDSALEAGSARSALIEVGGWASRATLDIIGLAGLGRDFGAISDPNTELTRTYMSVFKPSRQARVLALMGNILPGWLVNRLPVSRNNDVHAAAAIIKDTCRDLIRSKKEKLRIRTQQQQQHKTENGQTQDEKVDSETVATGDVDILTVALESGGFSDENLVDQLMTFLAAGHETTATAMTWAIYMLCRFPEVQSRLRAEIRERLPSPDDSAAAINSLDIDHMPYLNAVCSEVLRYYGPVPMTVREAARDTTIQGHFVPKGTRIILAPWAVNKSTALWGSDALQFNPDRWLATEDAEAAERKAAASGGATSNYAFLTFLHGPRSCIGASFAKAEFACLLASWLGRFEFELKNKEEMDEKNVLIKGGVTARPTRGMHVHAKVVEGW